MLTYLNKQGNPIIRQCRNCAFFKPISTAERTGYCLKMPLQFAFTGETTVFGITRPFYRCDLHLFINEDILKANSTAVEMDLNYKPKKDLNNGS